MAKSVSFTLTLNGEDLELTRSGRKTPLACTRMTQANLAWMYRRIAYYALELAHYADNAGDLFSPVTGFTADSLAYQLDLLKLDVEHLLDKGVS